MDLAEYSRFYFALYGKSAAQTEALLAEFGRTRAWYEQTKAAVDARASVDPKVAAEVNARVMLLNANVSKAALPPPAPAAFVRARKCGRCGGYKRTAPRTAYVYCDYCGVLFDFDESLASERASSDAGRLPILRALIDGTRAELHRAFEAHDDEAYLRAWHWPYEMDMLLCPESWSPRIGDPAYRAAMVDFCARTCLFQNRDPRRREASIRRGEAREAATKSPSEHTFLHYLACVWDLLVVEETAYRAAGMFDRHPDGLDAETYHLVNMTLNVLEWSTVLSKEDFDLLVRLSRIRVERAEVEPVALHQAACGHCSGRLLVVEGARSVVCEACGRLIDCGRAYPCSNCGARVLASSGARSATCGWCSTTLSLA